MLKQLYFKVSIMNLFQHLKLRLNTKFSIPFIIFIALCLIGCLYHVIEITDVYLKYQTKVDVSFDGDSQIVVPLVTFCRLREASYVNNQRLVQMESKTPSSIDNTTYNVSEVFVLCMLLMIIVMREYQSFILNSCKIMQFKLKSQLIIIKFVIILNTFNSASTSLVSMEGFMNLCCIITIILLL